MSWGALNNQRERASGDPLPGFLTGHSLKSFDDRREPQVQPMDDVICKPERAYTPRSEGPRGYGVSYSGSINIQMSKKTLFIAMLFFAAAILAAFGSGYAIGNISNTLALTTGVVISPAKKPVVPKKKAQASATKPSTRKEFKTVATPVASALEKNESQAAGVETAEEKSDLHILSEKNNKETNDSEPTYQDPESDPAATDEEMAD